MASFTRIKADGWTSSPVPTADDVNRWWEEAKRVRQAQRDPVKFEVGQVVRVDLPGRAYASSMLVESVDVMRERTISGVWLDGPGASYGLTVSLRSFGDRVELLSPAPQPADTWSNGESVARIEFCAHGDTSLRIVSEGEPFVGDVVAVARRLWEGGYRRVERSTASELRETMKDAAVQMTRLICGSEEAEKLRAAQRAPLPRAGDVYGDPNGTVVELRERDGQLYTEVLQSLITYPTLLEANDASMLAEMLREHGYRKVGEERAQEAKGEADEQLRARLEARFTQSRIDAVTPQSALDGFCIDRAADDLRKLAEALGAPELRAGMVIRDGVFRSAPQFGRVESTGRFMAMVRWAGQPRLSEYDIGSTRDLFNSGRWRIVDPDVRPLASLASAVAAIFATPDRETSRRYVDLAVRALRGEPFERAVQAALVGVCDIANLSPAEIAACIVALRHWEARRPFDRDLVNLKVRTNDWVRGGPWNRLQIECNGVLTSALGYAPKWDYDRIYFVYERARTS